MNRLKQVQCTGQVGVSAGAKVLQLGTAIVTFVLSDGHGGLAVSGPAQDGQGSLVLDTGRDQSSTSAANFILPHRSRRPA